MKRLIALLCLVAFPAMAQVQPIDDPAHLLDAAAGSKIHSALMANYDATKVHIVVWLPTLSKDDALIDKAVEYFKSKGIGQKGQDNGVLVLVDWANHRSRIEVGYGLEGVMTDARTKALQDNVMNAQFRKGDLPGGLLAGVNVLSGYSQEWLKNDSASPPPPRDKTWIVLLIAGVVVCVGALSLWAIAASRRRDQEERDRLAAAIRERTRREREEEMRSATRVPFSYGLAGAGAAAAYRSAPSRTKSTPTRATSSYAPVYTSTSSCSSRSSCSSSSSSSDSSSSSSYDSGGGSSGGGGSDSSW